MNYLGKVINNCKYIYNEINAATLTGAIDVVVVEQPDGTFTCSPFHVRFGKIGVLRSKEKVVDIEINGEPVDIHMKLGESGEAFFVEEVGEGEGEDNFIPPHLACSPIPPDGDRFIQSDWQRLEEAESENQNEESSMTTGSQTPRTFKAETVDELSEGPPRKLSTTEFRPINGQTLDESPPKETTEFVKEDSPSADENNTVTISKRKRRKKSIKKKHGNNVQKRNSIPTVPVQEVKVEEEKPSTNDAIFQMEDLDSAANEAENKVEKRIKEDIESVMELPTVQELPVERDIHFFSDTEITPGSSPRDQREFAPVQSDSEFETKRTGGVGGETVPNGVTEDHAQSWRWGELPTPEPEDKKQESQKWMHSMLGFMKKTKHMRHKNEGEGIYLSEVNSEDPEMAALYFPNPYKQTAPAPTQDFAEPSREEDAESGNGPSLPQSPHSVEGAICGPKWNPEDIALSLCGTEGTDTFDEHVISYTDLATDPGLVNNPKLVIRMDGKIYPWKMAVPLVMALFVYHKPLPQEIVARITGDLETEASKQEKEKQQKKIHYSSWFNWPRINEQQKFGEEPGSNIKEEERKIPKEAIVNKSMESNEGDLKEELSEQTCNTYEKYRKTLRLSSAQIAKLKLQPGANEIEFSVTTAYQGTSRCKCFLFCWRYDDKIVVSDIDGTITKSDVLGHILPIVGKDWAQSGVAKLFTKIKENGYKLLYLSARAIGQSRVTREYLKSIKQEDLTLPEGPMLLNPTSLLNAFHTEVIEKKPEEFKISCLRDIQALFPPHIKPFYAGYGNKINDVWAYQAVGIPIFRIFTINHKGELKHELTQTFQSTYSNMSGLVDQMFPASKPTSNEDFSEFVYWREPILDIDTLPEFTSQVKI